MREIIFRGKRTDNGEWIEGYYCGKYNKTFFSPAEDSAQIIDEDLYWHEVIPETVSQYTGLTDKNGVKIWEGDIVRADNGHTSKVVFRSSSFYLYCNCHKEYSNITKDIFEVIGNIHDNPELMGGVE